MQKTEMRNPNSMQIDRMDTLQILQVINEENFNAARAVQAALDPIAKACDAVAAAFARGGRLFYIGAGTSGRLGVVDAAECPPTFGVPSGMVVGIIAGGPACMSSASEGQEDDEAAGKRDLQQHEPRAEDVVVGISAAGNAAYVLGALAHAASLGCTTVGITSNYGSKLDLAADISIVTDTGPEVVTGSTRMKAGTAQKLVLNMLSTTAMIKTGKVYENLMINLQPTNEKLRRRVIAIVREILGCEEAEAVARLEAGGWDIRRTVTAAEREV